MIFRIYIMIFGFLPLPFYFMGKNGFIKLNCGIYRQIWVFYPSSNQLPEWKMVILHRRFHEIWDFCIFKSQYFSNRLEFLNDLFFKDYLLEKRNPNLTKSDTLGAFKIESELPTFIYKIYILENMSKWNESAGVINSWDIGPSTLNFP